MGTKAMDPEKCCSSSPILDWDPITFEKDQAAML